MARKPRDVAAAEPRTPQGPLAEAQAALDRGDFRRARALLRTLAQTGPEADRPAAAALLARTGPDPFALIAIGVVLLVILIAATLGIFRH